MSPEAPRDLDQALALFHPAVRAWFAASFPAVTAPQRLGWPAIARGDSTLILSPTGSGKTLAAFLWSLNRLMFPAVAAAPGPRGRCRIVYVSPIKALAVDIERNLREPLLGLARAATALGAEYTVPRVSIRTGDTPARERARFIRAPADILITTPESLYLLLTSQAREGLRSVEAVILDEIHALCGTKRGAHLALSLERLEALTGRRLQRIGLSATQRPLEEVAHFLGGAESAAESAAESGRGAVDPAIAYRPVTIVDAAERRPLELLISAPLQDMARPPVTGAGPDGEGGQAATIWAAIHPRLLTLIRAHRSTLLFVNSRRVAERLAAALNELAGETLCRAHHGSLSAAQRAEVEEQLKAGALRGLVATSSLELGIDMGAIDLVVQIEAPPSVASGLQRIGRASHQVGATSRGIIFPKFRADLLACAAAARAMHEGRVEATRYPRNPLDVLAQQIVAMVSMERVGVDELYALVRRAAPFAGLSRLALEGVLDLLSGRYPSDEFAELRPRLTWDRTTSVLTARQGARHIAVANAGTIPDRGLYGVFLAGAAGQKPGPRVGELDEEMVFESRRGDVFLLGASSWRVEEITFDRVLCSPAPGEPGKMPFWRGEAAGRPLEFGEAIGRLVRELRALPASAAARLLHREYDLDADAATNLLAFLDEQAAATGAVPSDEHLIIERYHDEVGDTRVCVLSPLGGRVHAPWCLAAAANVREQLGYMPESMWTDDGFALRVPHGSPLPEPAQLLPEPDAVEALVVRTLGESQLLMAKFREVAGRALLLPKRRPFGRSPLWHQRKRAAELFRVAAQYPSFPMLLEAYRECLRDVFDLQALVATLRRVKQGTIAVTVVDTHRPSPLARTLLFSYLASYIYEGDAPQAERRAQALSIDRERLAELVGEVNLRELLDAQSIAEVEAQLQSLEGRQHVRSADGLHDLLLRLGDLGAAELAARTAGGAASATSLATALVDDKRALWLRFGAAGGQPESRLVASEDAARYRDALGLALPDGMPPALLGPVPDALLGLLRRFARTHGPFTVAEAAARFGLLPAQAEPSLRQLRQSGRLVEGELRPASQQRDLCDEEVLQRLRRRALARARREIEPVPPRTLGRLLGHLQGVVGPGVRQRAHRRAGLDALLDAVQSLQGAPLVASQLEREILPARVADYTPAQLDTLLAAGELVWCGVESLGDHDGRVALFLTDQLPVLWRPRVKPSAAALSPRAQQLYTQLHRRGAQFFAPLHEAAGGGFTGATLEALWELVWAGLGTSDTLGALRAYLGVRAARPSASPRASAAAALRQLGFRSRRSAVPPAGQGRWVLTGAVPRDADVAAAADGKAEAAFSAAWAQQLLSRYGVVVRDTALAEGLPGGFAAVYPALKRMEETGRVRRGWFVAGQSATQFAVPAALELLRSLRDDPEHPESVVLCAADPANPYGALLKWPKLGRAEPLLPPAPEGAAGVTGAASESARTLQRSPGAYVVLVDGALTAYARRLRPDLLVFLPAEEPGRTRVARATAERLAELARRLPDAGLIITTVNQVPTAEHELAAWLQQAGFFAGASGYQISRRPSLKVHTATAGADYARYQAVELEPGEDAADAPDAEEPGAG